MVSSMMALVGAETKAVQASKTPLTPEGSSARYRPEAPSSTPTMMAMMMGENTISRTSLPRSALSRPSRPSRSL